MNLLDKIINNNTRKADTELKLGDQLVKEVYINRSHKIDIHGEDGLTDEQVKQLNLQRWVTTKKNITKEASLHGKAAVYYLYINGTKHIDSGRIDHYSSIAGWVDELTILTDRLHTYNDAKERVNLKWKLILDDKSQTFHYELSRFIVSDGEIILLQEEPFAYPTGEVPIGIVKNNIDEISDVRYFGVSDLVDKINYWAKQVQAEWANAGKSRPIQRSLYGAGESVAEFNKRYGLDTETVKQAGINSKLAGDSAPSGGLINGVGVALQTLGAMTQRFRDSVMLHNDNQSTGSNKHGLEIALSHQPAIDNLVEQKVERDVVFSQFLTNFFGVETTVDIHFSPITEAVMANMTVETNKVIADTGLVVAQTATELKGESDGNSQ